MHTTFKGWSKVALMNLSKLVEGPGIENMGSSKRYWCDDCGYRTSDYHEFQDHKCKKVKVKK